MPTEKFYFSYNKVSWYLGICTFSYFLFQNIACIFEKKYKKNRKIMCYAAIIICILIAFPLSISGVASSDFIKWLTYICPAYRLGDFILGFLLRGSIWKSRVYIKEVKILTFYFFYSCLEIAWLSLLFIWLWNYLNGDVFSVIRYDVFWLSLSLFEALIFYMDGGISALLRSRILVSIGDITSQAFLLHQIVIGFVSNVLDDKIIVTIISLFLTLVSCVTWDRLFILWK